MGRDRNHPQRQWSLLCAYCEQVGHSYVTCAAITNYVKGRQAVVNILDRMPLGEEVKRYLLERLLPCGKCGNLLRSLNAGCSVLGTDRWA